MLTSVQFLNHNLADEVGVQAAPISTFFGGDEVVPIPISFQTLTLTGFDGNDGSAQYDGIRIKTTRPPELADEQVSNLMAVRGTASAGSAFGDLLMVKAVSDNQTNFTDSRVYQCHLVGERDGLATYYLYFDHTSDAAANFWVLVRRPPAGVSRDARRFTLNDLFLGTSVAVDTPASTGLSFKLEDPSFITYSDSGRGYAVRKPKYYRISSMTLPFLGRCQRDALIRFYEKKGITEPFWVSIDPQDRWDGPSFGTSFGSFRFDSAPAFTHNFRDRFSASISLREAL